LSTDQYNEFADTEDQIITVQMNEFMNNLKAIFITKLRADNSKDEESIEKQANYLLLAKHGLAARLNNTKEDYIELTFRKI
jgi:hypothetical protein